MLLKPIAAASMLALSSAAFAVAPGDLGMIDGAPPIVIGNTVSGLLFDVYTFSLGTASTLYGSAVSLDVEPYLGLAGFSVVLQDSMFNVVGTDSSPSDGFSFGILSSGSYALTFIGQSTGTAGGSYGGSIYAVPVPEPETYALMLGGLAAIGFLANRRRRS